MSARASVTRTGHVDVALSPDVTLELFTPEGERRWIEGWAPTYPEGGAPSLREGLVFVTDTESGPATWVVARWEPEPGRAAYSYVVAGHRATHVGVTVEPIAGGTRARITYVMTSLASGADAFVEAFGADFDDHMATWSRLLADFAKRPEVSAQRKLQVAARRTRVTCCVPHSPHASRTQAPQP